MQIDYLITRKCYRIKVNNHWLYIGGSEDLFANTRFYFTSQGIEPKYNKAPQITADAIDVYQGDTSFNLTNGVKVTDDHDDINADGTLKGNTNTPSVATSNTTPTRNVLSYTITNKQMWHRNWNKTLVY